MLHNVHTNKKGGLDQLEHEDFYVNTYSLRLIKRVATKVVLVKFFIIL